MLVCHALTGDQYVAERHPVTGKDGWWDVVVGPGKPVDTDRFFVICANVLGGCMGSHRPAQPRATAATMPWGTEFPPVTIRDMVRAQKRLIDHLGIKRLFAVIGGSMGGMQALQWAACYPDAVFAALPIATAAYHSAQNIAFHEVGRQAIFADPDWHDGRYWQSGSIPARGLAVARMCAHITYLSEQALTRKFGRRLQNAPKDQREAISLFGEMFEVESYLRHQGSTFVERFDANSYLTITRAMDYFDLAADYGGDLANAFRGTRTRFLLVSFTSDWLFPTPESRAIAPSAQPRRGKRVVRGDPDPTKGTTHSCWTSRTFIGRLRDSWRAARCTRDWKGSSGERGDRFSRSRSPTSSCYGRWCLTVHRQLLEPWLAFGGKRYVLALAGAASAAVPTTRPRTASTAKSCFFMICSSGFPVQRVQSASSVASSLECLPR